MVSKEEGKTEYIRRRLLEAGSEEELEEVCAQLEAEPDIPSGSMRAVKSELKKKGAFQFKPVMTKAMVAGKALPIEALINDLYLPPIVDGTRQVFDSGVAYGMKSILIGVRVAQELSKMGIDQATPIIKMAQEMRQTEGQVAKETGMVMGETIASKLFDYMESKLPQKADIATVPKPFEGIFARAFETALSQFTNRLMGVSPQQGSNLPPGWADNSKKGGT
jgi:hypothetical protein